MQNSNDKFFDSKTLMAIIIVFGVIMGWQYYLTKKYPNMGKQTAPTEAVKPQTGPSKSAETGSTEKSAESFEKTETKAEEFFEYKSENINFTLSSRGMGIKSAQLNKFKERDGGPIFIAHNVASYVNETRINGQEVYFEIRRSNENTFEGRATVGGINVKKTISMNTQKYLLESKVSLNKSAQEIETLVSDHGTEGGSGSFLTPSFDHETVFVLTGTETERFDVKQDESLVTSEEFKNVTAAAIGKHYFATAILDKSQIMPSFSAINNTKTKEVSGSLKYSAGAGTDLLEITNDVFIGPKQMTLLNEVDPRLIETINFGWFSIIAIPILKLLKFFYSIAGNYGVAIILVTLLIRLILLPINISSFRSMKKMQDIQPQLKALKEKYKSDPRKLQAETMNIMKVNKVNPIGGCLPMLLQLPIFIALYNVLAQSIELYQAPFIFWIKDLSFKDSFYVLPVLMGITMYIQQKITPTTMDPAQAKAMQIMPVIFSFLMISLPSGLTLYIFVSTLFGIVQQYMIMKQKT